MCNNTICNKLMGGGDRCLCGLMHVKTGTWIIAIGIHQKSHCFHIVLAILLVIESVTEFINVTDSSSSTRTKIIYGIQAVLMVIWLILCVLLILGLRGDNPSRIFPHWIVSVIVFIWLCIQVGLIIWDSATLWQIILHIIFALVLVYLLCVEYRCYQWMSGGLPV